VGPGNNTGDLLTGSVAWDIISLRISGPDRRLAVMHFTLQQRADSTAQYRNGSGMKNKSNVMQLSGAIHAMIDLWLALPPKESGLRSRLDSLKRKGGISGSILSKIRLTEDKKLESTPRSRQDRIDQSGHRYMLRTRASIHTPHAGTGPLWTAAVLPSSSIASAILFGIYGIRLSGNMGV
jgi:hypothetical protein